MNKVIHKWMAAIALVGAVLAAPAQAATYSVDGSKGQSLIVTLGAWSGIELAITTIGDKINKIFDVDDSITYQLTSSGTNSTLKLFSFTGGTFSLSPTVKGLVSLNVTKSLGSVAVVPEPETYALLALGLVGLGVARQRKKAREINAFPALTA